MNTRDMLCTQSWSRCWAAKSGPLMELVPPVGWGDVATKHDLDELRVATKHDLDEASHNCAFNPHIGPE